MTDTCNKSGWEKRAGLLVSYKYWSCMKETTESSVLKGWGGAMGGPKVVGQAMGFVLKTWKRKK